MMFKLFAINYKRKNKFDLINKLYIYNIYIYITYLKNYNFFQLSGFFLMQLYMDNLQIINEKYTNLYLKLKNYKFFIFVNFPDHISYLF